MYKITFTGSIKRLSDSTIIPPVSANMDYQQFVDDIFENGTGIVEGADYVGVTTYTQARKAEYPPIEDQLDKIYHGGIDAWKADIKVIKDKYPKTQVGITSIAPLPDWVNTALFNKQKEEYIKAKERLNQYELTNGIKDFNGNYIIRPIPIAVEKDGETIRNPLVVRDEAEREAAQEVINQTPQAVIDSINT
jgi:hypothetical protein|tara:strand:- start:140 stop:715 length:576 start_codon:yes stop_codon:yes gene_type:complete